MMPSQMPRNTQRDALPPVPEPPPPRNPSGYSASQRSAELAVIICLVSGLTLGGIAAKLHRASWEQKRSAQAVAREPRTVMEDRQELLRCLEEHGEALVSTDADGRRVIECPVQ